MEAPVWVPYVFLKTIFLWSLVFYTVVGIACRVIVKRVWPGDDPLSNRKRDTLGRWTPSLIHATIAAVTGALAIAGNHDIFDNEGVIMHSLGYFLGDLIVDRDPGYVVHHLGPIMHAEVLLRLGAGFWHTMKAGWWCEMGNVVAHSAAVFTFRRGTTFHTINTLSFWISRPASYYDGFMAWYADLPAASRWTWLGLIPLISILGIYHANTKWMIQMCKNHKKHKAKTSPPLSPSTPTTPSTPNTPSTPSTPTSPTSDAIANGFIHNSNGIGMSDAGVVLDERNSKKLGPTLPNDVPLEPQPHRSSIERVSSRKSAGLSRSLRDKDA